MTLTEITNGKLAAAEVLWEIRRHGGFVLRVVHGDAWRLRIFNGKGVPGRLKLRLAELKPFAMILLRELV